MPAGSLVGILAAAGTGERLGTGEPKAFVRCGGRLLLEWSLEPLTAACDRVVVALPPGARPPPPLTGWGLGDELSVVEGAASRSGSVAAAVRAAPEARTFVVHDAARPLVTRDLIERCVGALSEGVQGAVAAARVTDTVKEAGPDGRVVRTLDRSRLWAVQTPQAFTAAALRRAQAVDPEALAAATDDASLVEAAGGAVRVVDAPPENLKVTRASDLAAVEAMLASAPGG